MQEGVEVKIKAFVADKNQFCAVIIFVFVAVMCLSSPAQAVLEGYYKDLFMDGGANLTSRTTLPAAALLGLSMEYLATSNATDQNTIMVQMDNGDWQDDNGALLYPDGEPRFRCFYSNGGDSIDHGASLGEDGRQRIRDFYANGGSYTGSCAGSALPTIRVTTSSSNTDYRTEYYHIWPARGRYTQLAASYTGHDVPMGSPLLNYYDFGGDYYIASVRHNGGNYTIEDDSFYWCTGTEVLTTFAEPIVGDDPTYQPFMGHVSAWAYKDTAESGRLCPCGSHPESITSGERREMMASFLLYAMDGNGDPTVKAALENGVIRQMNDNSTSGHEKLGDLQYHHFTVDLPAGMSWLRITLDGDAYDLNLFARKDDFAFEGEPGVVDANNDSGADETITIVNPSGGTWYVGVKCATTVTSVQGNYCVYSGALGVLNGVAYSITAEWNGPNGDLTYDGKVDYNDVKMLSLHWLESNRHYREGSGLIGWWEFDDGDGNTAADSSGYENTATLYNEPNWQSGVLEFDGVDDYVQTADDANKLQLTGSYTLSVWLKTDAVQSDWAGILAKCAAGSGKTPNHWSLLFGGPGVPDTTGKLVVWNGMLSPTKWDTRIELSDLSGLWHHIAIVRSSTTMASYLDGKMVTYGIFEVDPDGGYGHLNIGTERSTRSCYKGLIGDVSIYDYQLTSDEVRDLSLEHPVGQLVGWWNFDDADANDSSGNGHHGTFMYDATTVIDGNIAAFDANNKALLLDGTDDYVNLGGGGSGGTWADMNDAMSIVCWIKLPDGYTNDYQPAVAKSDSWHWYRNYNGNGIRFYTTNTTDTYINYEPQDDYPYIYLDDGQWHHTAATFDAEAGMRHIYIDGYHVMVEAVSGTIAKSTYDLAIGARLAYSNRWKGLIDDVRLYDYALSHNAVKWLREGAQTGQPPDYVCFEKPPGDINRDCKTDLLDYAILALHWMESEGGS